MINDRLKDSILLEEKPLVELPFLLKVFLVVAFLGMGLSLLFLPYSIVLALFVGICVAIGILFNPFIGAMLLITAAYVHPIQFMPQLIKYHVTTITAFVILLIWGFHILIYRDFHIPKSRPLLCFFGFVFIASFSSFLHWEESSFLYIDLLKVFILFFLIVNLTKTRKNIFVMVVSLLVLGCLASTYAIYQRFHGMGLVYTGEGIIRVSGFSNSPNAFALSVLLLIPFAFGLLVKVKSVFLKVFLFSMLGMFILGIMFSYSRAVFIALPAVLFLSTWKFVDKNKRLIGIVAILIIIAIALPFVPQKYMRRVESITDLNRPSIKSRLDGYIIGFQMMVDHPFLGVGIGRWHQEYWPRAFASPLIQTKSSSVQHNIFIEVGSETGIIGLTLFLLLLFFAFKDIRIAHRIFVKAEDSLLSIFSQSLEISLIGFLIATMFVAAIHVKFLWVVLGLILALKNLATTNTKIPKGESLV